MDLGASHGGTRRGTALSLTKGESISPQPDGEEMAATPTRMADILDSGRDAISGGLHYKAGGAVSRGIDSVFNEMSGSSWLAESPVKPRDVARLDQDSGVTMNQEAIRAHNLGMPVRSQEQILANTRYQAASQDPSSMVASPDACLLTQFQKAFGH